MGIAEETVVVADTVTTPSEIGEGDDLSVSLNVKHATSINSGRVIQLATEIPDETKYVIDQEETSSLERFAQFAILPGETKHFSVEAGPRGSQGLIHLTLDRKVQVLWATAPYSINEIGSTEGASENENNPNVTVDSNASFGCASSSNASGGYAMLLTLLLTALFWFRNRKKLPANVRSNR